MSQDQEETMPVDYELEIAFQQAKELLAQYPAATDGSEDRLERHAAFTLARLAGKLQERAPFAKGTFVTEQVVDTVARFHAEQFKVALEEIAKAEDSLLFTSGKSAVRRLRDIALGALKAVEVK